MIASTDDDTGSEMQNTNSDHDLKLIGKLTKPLDRQYKLTQNLISMRTQFNAINRKLQSNRIGLNDTVNLTIK